MRRFRFKTLEEFGGVRPRLWNSMGLMDLYFGMELVNFEQDKIIKAYETKGTFNYKNPEEDGGSWYFSGENLVEIKEEKINMERIYKEDWHKYHICQENIMGIEMQSGQKYFLQLNNGGVIPVNLKSYEDVDFIDVLELGDICNRVEFTGNKKVFKFSSMQDMITWATS